MCGRFAFYSPREAVTALFGVNLPLPVEPRYNIAPGQYVAALRAADGSPPEPAMLRWGLVPGWARDPVVGNRMINARAETVAEKPAYRAAFRHRPCVVLADGFYEWQASAGGKQPWYITAADGQPFAMAGLWERWDRGESPLETCTIITTAASAWMARLHHRMPVILAPEQARQWLARPSRDLLVACDDAALAARPVSRRVNNAAHEGPELIAAAD